MWVAVFTLLGVSPWLVPQGKIEQQPQGREGAQERLSAGSAMPRLFLSAAGGRDGVTARELGGCPLTHIHCSLQKAIPAELAVDVGCGSGQGTHFLGEHFKKVVGTDISAAQIQEAKDTPGMPNISYL